MKNYTFKPSQSKRLHICTFNHDVYGVTDQVRALVDMVGEHIPVTVSDEMVMGVDNLLIENFNHFQNEEINKHQVLNSGRLFVLLTEHCELDVTGSLRLNEQQWSTKREYIPDIYQRFLSLVELSNIIDGFVVLYGNPQKSSLRTVFPSTPIFDLAEFAHYSFEDGSCKEYDFCFIGSQTKYREQIIKELRTRFSIYAGTGLSDEERGQIIRNSSFTLNIPQHEGWSNLSPMRIIAAAREGTRTVNVAERNGAKFPYVTTFSLQELLRLSLGQVRERCILEMRPDHSSHAYTSDLAQFIRWLS